MNDQIFDLHLADVFNLARSIVIKNEQTALALNRAIQLKHNNYIISEEQPETWKYYMNLAGQYHRTDIEAIRDYNYSKGIGVIKNVRHPLNGQENGTVVVTEFIYDNLEVLVNETSLQLKIQYGVYSENDNTDTLLGEFDSSDFSVQVRNKNNNTTTIGFDATAWDTKIVNNVDNPNALYITCFTNNGYIVVKSCDTLENIEFTVDTLVSHKATAMAYEPGDALYSALISDFMDYELLIKGISHPVDITKSISAKDGTILTYNTSLVEESEISIIQELQTLIDNSKFRWTVPGYFLLDELYNPALESILYIHLPSIIENLRLSRCKTHEAHSWHIKQYLASHCDLDIYFNYLTREQALFLYRNIRYIQRYAGRTHTFDMLVENMLRKRGIPLKEWNMKHNISSMSELDDFLPSTEMIAKDIIVTGNSYGGYLDTVDEVMLRENPKAMNNPDEYETGLNEVTLQNNRGENSFLKTKVLESYMIDNEDTQPFKMAEILYNHWIYLSCTTDSFGNPAYRSSITVKHPVSGDEYLLKMREAYVLYFYAMNQAIGMGLENELFVLDATDVSRQWIELKYKVKEDSIDIGGMKLNEDYHVIHESSNGVTRIVFDKVTTLDQSIFVKYYFNGGFIPQMKANRVKRRDLRLEIKDEHGNVVVTGKAPKKPTDYDPLHLDQFYEDDDPRKGIPVAWPATAEDYLNWVADKECTAVKPYSKVIDDQNHTVVVYEPKDNYAVRILQPLLLDGNGKRKRKERNQDLNDPTVPYYTGHFVELKDTYVSIEDFYTMGTWLYQELLANYRLCSFVEDRRVRGYVEKMSDMIYHDVMVQATAIQLDENGDEMYDENGDPIYITDYETWFSQNNISIPYMSKGDWANFALDIYMRATGLEFFQKNTARSIQKAMVSIVEKLSSYNIQIIANMIDNIYDCGSIVLRLEKDLDTFAENGFRWDNTTRVYDRCTNSWNIVELTENTSGADLYIGEFAWNCFPYKLPVKVDCHYDIDDMEDIPFIDNLRVWDFTIEELSQWDSDAEILFARLTTEISNDDKERINTLIQGLKTYGFWDRLDTLYIPSSAATEELALLDWKRPTKSATFHNDVSWDQNSGFVGSGNVGWVNIDFTPSIDGDQYTANKGGIGCYVTQFDSFSRAVFGTFSLPSSTSRISCHSYAIDGHYRTISINGDVYSWDLMDVTSGASEGLIQLNRYSSNSASFFMEAEEVGVSTYNVANRVLPSQPMYLLASNDAGSPQSFSGGAIGVFYMGDVFYEAEQENIRYLLDAYFTGDGS